MRRDLPVGHIPVVGDPMVHRCPALVGVEAGPAAEAPALLGDAVTVWDPMVLLGPVVEGLVPVKP